MTLVAMSASYAAGGSLIAPAVAERPGVPFVDRAIPLAVADRLDVPYDDAVAHDDQVHTGWLERALSGFVGADTGAPSPLPPDLVSTEDFRQAMHLDPTLDAERAERMLRQFDRTHAAYLHQFYGVDIHDCGLYRLVLDSTAIEFGACVELIAQAAPSMAAPVDGRPG